MIRNINQHIDSVLRCATSLKEFTDFEIDNASQLHDSDYTQRRILRDRPLRLKNSKLANVYLHNREKHFRRRSVHLVNLPTKTSMNP